MVIQGHRLSIDLDALYIYDQALAINLLNFLFVDWMI